MATDTTINNLIINKLTKAQYQGISNPSETELYLVPDEMDSAPVEGSTNPVESGGVYTALAGKQDTITGGATTIASANLTASRALISNSSGKVVISNVTSTELGYLSGATSNIQTQLNAKQDALVSGTNIKTINNESLLGEGNITIEGGSGGQTNVIETVKVNGTALTPDANKAVNITSIPSSIVTQDATHRFVSDTEKTTWNNKSDFSGSYNDLTDKPNHISYTDATATVAGTSKTVSKVNPETLYVPNGLVMGGTAAAAGLVTRGICGVGTPSTTGAAEKENLYINYDGNNTFNANRQLVLMAGTVGTHLGNNMYQYTVPRGEIVKNWVEAKGYTTNTGTITGITMNGASKGTSGVVDLGTVITSHQDISGKADKSVAIGSLSLSLDSTNYKITLSGTKVDGTTFTVQNVIDLPLESVVVNGSYNNTNKKVVLTLQSGSTVEFSVADLVNGLQSEITSTNKLSADLIADGTTNKTVTATEKSTWNNKQNALSNASVLSGITSTKVTNWDAASTNSHTHSNKSVLDDITSTDITNWNSKTDNVGTVTGVKINNTTKSPSNGIVDLGTVITEHQDISGKANTADLATVATSGSYNDLTNKPTIPTVNNATITLTFNGSNVGTFTLNQGTNQTIDIGSIIGLPSYSASNNGQILGVVNGALTWITPTTIYTGTTAPSNSQGNDGDIYLQTN